MPSSDITFSDFMAARWGPLYRTAYLLTGERHEAEDLLQDALARTCVRWGEIRELGCSFGSVKSQTHVALRRLRAALPDLQLVEEMS